MPVLILHTNNGRIIRTHALKIKDGGCSRPTVLVNQPKKRFAKKCAKERLRSAAALILRLPRLAAE